MYTSGEDVLDFRLNFTVTKKKRAGFLNMSTYNQETVILDNGKIYILEIKISVEFLRMLKNANNAKIKSCKQVLIRQRKIFIL